MVTPEGLFRVIEVTSFLPGRIIPADWVMESAGGELPFFFLPSNWDDENYWGSWFNHRLPEEKRFPLCFSTGFATAGEALTAASEWERTIEERANRDHEMRLI